MTPKATQRGNSLAAALVLAIAAALAGCSSHAVVDSIPTALGGLPEGVPPRPASAPPYPAVHDMPPSRADAVMSNPERQRLRDELLVKRDSLHREATTEFPTGSTAGAAARP